MFVTALTWGVGPGRGSVLIVNMASRRIADGQLQELGISITA